MKGAIDCAVIGAGPSGLVTCKVLRDLCLSVEVFEKSSHVGGQWAFSHTGENTGMYDSLRTNTSKSMCRFSDFDLPRSYPDYPDHQQMSAWFESYAEQFNLLDSINLNKAVREIHPIDKNQWLLITEDGTESIYRNIIIATGFNKPVLPLIPGNFLGQKLHSHDYLNPLNPIDFRNKKVLIVGLGNTACDLAVELSDPQYHCSVSLAVRSGHYIAPRIGDKISKLIPHPSQPPNRFTQRLPYLFVEKLTQQMLPLAYSILPNTTDKPHHVGLPPSPKRVTPFNLVINDEFIKSIKERNISVFPEIKSFNGYKVCFRNGAQVEFDIILFSTGYRAHFPFLGDVISADFESTLRLYNGIMTAHYSSLFFIGFVYGYCSRWAISEQQARWVAQRILSNDKHPPIKETTSYSVYEKSAINCQYFINDMLKK